MKYKNEIVRYIILCFLFIIVGLLANRTGFYKSSSACGDCSHCSFGNVEHNVHNQCLQDDKLLLKDKQVIR